MIKYTKRLSILISVFLIIGLPISASAADPNAVDTVNSAIEARGAQWTAGQTSVSRLPEEARRALLGLEKRPLEEYLPGSSRLEREMAVSFPVSLDWRDKDGCDWTTPIRNQGNCGSCWAFGSVALMESQMEIQAGDCLLNPNLSEQFMVSCSGGSCNGWFLDDTADFLQSTGTVDEACFPYVAADVPCNNRCADWQDRIVKICGWGWVGGSPGVATVDEFKAELEEAPIYGSMAVYEDFYYYTGGVYEHVSGPLLGYHAFEIVGWDDANQCWICKNSWGPGWGEAGWFRIKMGQNESEIEQETIWFLPCEYQEPDIDVSPTSLEITLPPDSTGPLTLTIANAGNGNLIVSSICDEEGMPSAGAKSHVPDLEGIRYPTMKETMQALGLKNNPTIPEAQGDVIKQCSTGTPTTSLMGLHYAQDQNILYVVSEAGTGIIYKMDENCNVTGTLPGPSAEMNGITFDGQNLWITDFNGPDGYSDWIYKVDPGTGTVLGSWDMRPRGFSGVAGIAWDGQYLWAGSLSNQTVFKLDISCNILGSFTVSWTPAGLAWDGQFLISADTFYDGAIYRMTTAGTVVDVLPSPMGAYNFGVTCGTGGLWVSNFYFDVLYLMECDWCGPGPCDCDPDAPWMSVSPTSGTVAPGGSMAVTISFNTAGMGPGDYAGTIKIASNDPDEGCVVVPVTLHVGVVECIVECMDAESGILNIVDTSATSGSGVTVTVEINGAPNPVEALGFQVTFNPNTCLEYTGDFAPGDLTADFAFFNCNLSGPGVVTCGGFDIGGIPEDASGTVVALSFSVTTPELDQPEEAVRLDLQNLVDGFAGWSTSPGFICSASCDINGDGDITPMDALCAFQKYLGICPTGCGPCDEISCDVNRDDDCTPADALEIFREYLGIRPNACSTE